MAVVDKAMEAAAATQRDRARGQASLLDVLAAGAAAPRLTPGLPDVPEWGRAQVLASEKETLGFYITGHPLAEYRTVLERRATGAIGDLAGMPDKATVRLGAIVTAVKEISTKSGDRMAFVTLEDLSGTLEAVVFPDVYRSSMLHLAKDSLVLVKGQLDVAEETVKLLVSEVAPLAGSGNGAPALVEVTLAGAGASSDGLQRLRALVERHPGEAAFRIQLHLPEGGYVIIAPASTLTIAPGESFQAAVEAEFGPGCVAVK
jgi:DNA polymerase-3 subunit alpha